MRQKKDWEKERKNVLVVGGLGRVACCCMMLKSYCGKILKPLND